MKTAGLTSATRARLERQVNDTVGISAERPEPVLFGDRAKKALRDLPKKDKSGGPGEPDNRKIDIEEDQDMAGGRPTQPGADLPGEPVDEMWEPEERGQKLSKNQDARMARRVIEEVWGERLP